MGKKGGKSVPGGGHRVCTGVLAKGGTVVRKARPVSCGVMGRGWGGHGRGQPCVHELGSSPLGSGEPLRDCSCDGGGDGGDGGVVKDVYLVMIRLGLQKYHSGSKMERDSRTGWPGVCGETRRRLSQLRRQT